MEERGKIVIHTENIHLDQALKLASLVGSGAEAKYMVQQGLVKVNGEVCRQRKRKLEDGDQLEMEGKTFLISSLKDQ